MKVIGWGENRLPTIAWKPSGGMELGFLPVRIRHEKKISSNGHDNHPVEARCLTLPAFGIDVGKEREVGGVT